MTDETAASIGSVVDEVVSADVVAYGVGWPDKVPPPETLIPDDGWTVDLPGGPTLVAVAAGSRSWIAVALVALLVIGGAIVLLTRGTTPGQPAASATAPVSPSATAASGCAQPPGVSPIVAVFSQPTFSTTYHTVVADPGGCKPTFQWAGPNCGSWTPQQAQNASGPETLATMVWQHPHPPCDPTTSHADVTVVLTVTYQGGALRCTYQGAESGTGPACSRQ